MWVSRLQQSANLARTEFAVNLSYPAGKGDRLRNVGCNTYLRSQFYASIAHLVERLFCNQEAVGSSPAGGTIYVIVARTIRQLTATQLHAGLNPVDHSNER